MSKSPPLVTNWFLPSFHGDFRVERDGEGCKVAVALATSVERQALDKLAERAVKKSWWLGKPWTEKRPPFTDNSTTKLAADVETVAKWLAKALKPDRKLVTAVRFAGGKIEELVEQGYEDDGKGKLAVDVKAEPVKVEAKPLSPPEPVAAVTVAQPVRGCPAPDFAPAEVRARAVLGVFLTPEQLSYFIRFNRFVAVVGVTGHRYMVTSRHAKDALSSYQRTLYDLDERMPICTHDWTVPAAEEMLALGLLVQLPGYETWLRTLPPGEA